MYIYFRFDYKSFSDVKNTAEEVSFERWHHCISFRNSTCVLIECSAANLSFYFLVRPVYTGT